MQRALAVSDFLTRAGDGLAQTLICVVVESDTAAFAIRGKPHLQDKKMLHIYIIREVVLKTGATTEVCHRLMDIDQHCSRYVALW